MEKVHLRWLCVCVCEVSLSLKHGQIDQVMPFGIVLIVQITRVLKEAQFSRLAYPKFTGFGLRWGLSGLGWSSVVQLLNFPGN